MNAVRTPKTTKAAAALLKRYAELDQLIANIEAIRNELIASANSTADAAADPLILERAVILEKIEPWWTAAAAELTQGKRKSIELGGCMIGSRAGRESLGIAGKEDDVVKALSTRAWAKPLLKVKTTLDRRAVLMSLTGVYKKQLASLGLSRVEAGETFYVERLEQGGTLAGANP